MVMACCNRCYVKYIKEDKSLNDNFIAKNFGEHAKVEVRSRPSTFNSARKTYPDTEETYILYNGQEELLCTCACHVEGVHCLH